MLKKLPNLFTCILLGLSFSAAKAQVYQTMPISSGFNADVIANGVGSASSSTSTAYDAGPTYCLSSLDFQQTAGSPLPTVGLPVNGLLNSAATPGLTFQLAPYTGNNSLRMTSSTAVTLTFATPVMASRLFLIGSSANANGVITATVKFSDNSTQAITGIDVPDWYDSTVQPTAYSGFGRVTRSTGVQQTPAGNPRFYQMTLDILPANLNKNVVSVAISRTSTGASHTTNIVAVSAELSSACQAPYNLASVSALDGGTINWTAPLTLPSDGYDYYLTSSATAPTASTTPTGNVAVGTNTKTLTGLIAGQTYYFWIRSNCGTEKGVWQQRVFTAGQISVTYTTGDISTSYLASPTVTSPTTCPGALSLTVPAGYKIASVGTSYTMTAASTGTQTQQRSLLVCTTNNTTEAAVTAGPSVSTTGVASYNRNNLNIANDLTGTVNFELRAWRTSGTTPVCAANLNKVTNNSWTVTATLVLDSCTTPAAPGVTAQSVCPGATVADLQATGIAGAIYKWFDVPTGGSPLASTTVLVNGNYYVTQSVGNCESPVSSALAVTLAPTALPTADPQTFCNGATVAGLLTTSGTNIKWYAAATGGSPLAGTVALVHGNYYVSQTVNGCESARATIAITVNTTPAPTVEAIQTFCANSGATVANLVATPATDATIKWYATETATTPLASTAVLGTGTYYVSQVLGVCEGVRVPVSVAVATVVAPVGNPIEVCEGATVANLQGDGNPSATYKWFATQDSTTPLALDTPVTNGTYYVSQTLGACEGPKATVQVTVNNIAAPEVADQEFCAGATAASLEATPATGAAIRWYATETSTSMLSASAPLVSGTYYVSQKLNLCESDRTAVEITVHDVVPALTTPTLGVCIGSTIGDLTMETAEGAILKWYVSNGAVTPLAAGTNVTATTYYVTQSLGECESAKAPVEISFNVIGVPTTTSFEVCTGTTFAELAVEGTEGASFSWYATNEDIIELDETGVVSAGTYYVSQTVEGCEGARVPVAVSLIFTESPAPVLTQAFCGDAFVTDLVSGANEEYVVNWYSPEGELLTAESSLATGTYTVSQTANGCESVPVSVSVIMTGIPGMPEGATEQDFTAGQTTADLEVEFVENANVQWFFLDGDDWINIPAGTPLVDGGVYGVQQSIGSCESDILSIEVNMILSGEEFELSNLAIYPNPASDVLTIEGKEMLSEVVIINLLGQKVLNKQVNAASAQINVTALPQATYILQVYGVNGGTASFKIVKQ